MKLKYALGALLLALMLGCASTQAPAPKQRVFFVEPQDGATVGQEFKVVMGVAGMDVKLAGDLGENTGHHHLLIDAEDVAEGVVVPVDQPNQYLHFGKGQTETMVKLPPGKHKLTLQFADGAHRSYGEKMRASISVTVQ